MECLSYTNILTFFAEPSMVVILKLMTKALECSEVVESLSAINPKLVFRGEFAWGSVLSM